MQPRADADLVRRQVREILAGYTAPLALTLSAAPSLGHCVLYSVEVSPEVVGRTLAHYLDMSAGSVSLPFELPIDVMHIQRLTICACGTAYFAGLIAEYWFERLRGFRSMSNSRRNFIITSRHWTTMLEVVSGGILLKKRFREPAAFRILYFGTQ